MRSEGRVFHGGEQLELDLFPGVPWDGRSPRGLTRGRSGIIFEPGGGGRELNSIDPRQYEMWPSHPRARQKSHRRSAPMAPLLVELGFRESWKGNERRGCYGKAR